MNEDFACLTNSASDWVETMWGGREPQDEKLKTAIEDACNSFEWFALTPVVIYEGEEYPVVNRKSVGDWDRSLLDEFGIIYHITMAHDYTIVRGVLKEALPND